MLPIHKWSLGAAVPERGIFTRTGSGVDPEIRRQNVKPQKGR